MGILIADLQHVLSRIVEANEVFIAHNQDFDRVKKEEYKNEQQEVVALIEAIQRQLVITNATAERIKHQAE